MMETTELISDKLISDRDFLCQFEDLSLDPIHFDHIGHLRLGWLYLLDHDVDTSVELVCKGLKTYAESLGAMTKFHVTMTNAFVRIMGQRVKELKIQSFESFLSENNDLIVDWKGVLGQYYSDEVLYSETARISLIEPDVQSFRDA